MPRGNVTATEVVDPIHARLLAALDGFLDPDQDAVAEWFRLPSVQSLTSAQMPAVALVVDGLTGPPTYDRRTGYTASWDVTVAVYLRGADWDQTRSRLERYVASIRGCLLTAPQGQSRAWRWADEHYDQTADAANARTLGAGYLTLTVEVVGASVPGLPADPAVMFTTSTVSARPSRGFVDDL